MDERKPLPAMRLECRPMNRKLVESPTQGLTLVHFSAQLKRVQWDRGAFRGSLGGIFDMSGGIRGVCRVHFMSETAQVGVRSGRV